VQAGLTATSLSEGSLGPEEAMQRSPAGALQAAPAAVTLLPPEEDGGSLRVLPAPKEPDAAAAEQVPTIAGRRGLHGTPLGAGATREAADPYS